MYNKEMAEFEKKINLYSKSFEEILWNNTINDYAKNLVKTNGILEELVSKEEYFKEFKEEIVGLQNGIDKYIKTVTNPEYQIAIVGAIKAGKSTLINSLLGYDLASVDVTPETATLTKIKSSEKSYIKISFYSKEEWNKIWTQANNPKRKAEVFLKEYNEINAEIIKDEYLSRVDSIFYSENLEELKKEIKKWTSSKAKEHYFVKEIEIGLKILNLDKQICIVDTPGLNDVVEYRSNITLDYIDRANAVIVCVNAKTLRNEELVTIARVFSKARYKKDKIYVLGTQIDTLNTIEDWKKQEKEWRKYLLADEYFNTPKLLESNLFGVSAYLYNILRAEIPENKIIAKYEAMELITEDEADELRMLKKEKTIEDFKLSESIKNKILKFSNIDKTKEIIFEKLIEKYNESLLTDFYEKYKILNERILSFKNSHVTSLKELLNATTLNKNELESTLAAKRKEVENMKNKIKEISANVDRVTTTFNFDFKDLEGKFNEIKEEIRKIEIK